MAQQPPRTLIPRPRPSRTPQRKASRRGSAVRAVAPVATVVFAFALAFFALPSILATDIQSQPQQAPQPFPVSVHPDEKTIVTDPQIEKQLSVAPTALSAASNLAEAVYTWIAVRISQTGLYRQVAGVAGINNLFVTVSAGERAEEVAYDFGSTLRWTSSQRTLFLKTIRTMDPPLPDGQIVPGTYFVSVTDPKQVAGIVHDRFQSEILDRYSSTTEEQVPLDEALTIASLLQREAGGWDDMRVISGIIWNRLFKNMNLQIDATMQYSKASLASGKGGWWPTPLPADKTIKNKYNTYNHAGLPPGPIAEPSVAAVVAALNPKKTDCLFYFHDQYGRFHCSATYAQHVALLKKYYGQGK